MGEDAGGGVRSFLQGIFLASHCYPQSFDAETLEPITRAIVVLWRHEHYPKKKRHATQATNDFATYTQLSIEGVSCGYHSFIQSCQQDPDHLEPQRIAIKESWPTDPHVHHMVEELATAYLTTPHAE